MRGSREFGDGSGGEEWEWVRMKDGCGRGVKNENEEWRMEG